MFEFAISNVETGKLNAMVKNLMKQIEVQDANEAVKLFNAGLVEVKLVKHIIIDCSVQPFTPDVWSVNPEDQLPNRISRKDFEFNSQNLFFYFSDKQKQGVIEGNELKKELESQKVLPANVLDFLLEHQKFIPEEWKGKIIFFFGTIYRNSIGDLFVCCLRWGGDKWHWCYNWLGNDWGGLSPAVCVSV